MAQRNPGPVDVKFSADISTPGTPTLCFTISMPSAAVAHKAIFHRPTYSLELKPGMILEVQCTGATAGVYAKGILYVEPRWEEPGNVTTMQAST